MKKRILSLVIVGILLLSMIATSFAEEATTAKSFTLQEAIDYAIENSTQLKKLNADIDAAEIDVKKAGKAYNSTKDYSLADMQTGISAGITLNDSQQYEVVAKQTFDSSIDTILQLARVKNGYYKEATKMGLMLTEKGKEMATEGIEFSVEQSYFNVLHAQENLDIQKSILSAAKQNLDAGNKKLELGLVSEIEVMSFEIAYSQAEIGYKSAVRQLEYAKMTFNKAVGLPLDTKVELTEVITIEPPEEVDLNEKVSEALQNRMEVISGQEQYNLSKLNYDICKSASPGSYDLKIARYTLESNECELAETKKAVELSVQKAYMDMMDAYEGLTILDKSIVQVEKVYDATKKRYEVGMATENEVIESLNQLQEIKLQRSEVAAGYNLAKKMFKVTYGIGLGTN